MTENNKMATIDLIQAALDSEATISYLLNNSIIKGVVTRMPLEKLIAAIDVYKQSSKI
jgi:hypothetical protein